jgi:hypothetical protein
MARIKFEFEDQNLEAETLETATALAILAALPQEARVNTWGDELYFDSGVDMPREKNARALMTAGEIAYWPDGSAIAIGFGPTPISAPGEIRLASPCNIWAKAIGDVRKLKTVKPGSRVRFSRA